MISCANRFREWWEGEFRPEDGRRKDRGGSVRVARDRSFRRLQRLNSFYLFAPLSCQRLTHGFYGFRPPSDQGDEYNAGDVFLGHNWWCGRTLSRDGGHAVTATFHSSHFQGLHGIFVESPSPHVWNGLLALEPNVACVSQD